MFSIILSLIAFNWPKTMILPKIDLIAVGAGFSGIAAAKFYLETRPDNGLLFLEQDNCLAGLWNSRRSFEDISDIMERGDSRMIEGPRSSSARE